MYIHTLYTYKYKRMCAHTHAHFKMKREAAAEICLPCLSLKGKLCLFLI